jgi:hypothetical protein
MGAALLAAACGGSEGSVAGWDGVERDSAGITIVENFGTPLWGDEPLWTFHEVLRIGTAEGDPDYQFGRITGLVVLSDRRVLVADRLAHNVRFFSSEGTLLQAVGKAGGGPGEYGEGSIYLARMPGDTIFVIESRSREVNVYSPDGTLVDDFSLATRDGYQNTDFDTDPSGRFATRWEPMPRSDVDVSDLPTVVTELDASGNTLDTLAVVPSLHAFERDGDTFLRYFYRGQIAFEFCGGGIWIGPTNQFRLGWHRSGGAPERVLLQHHERLTLDASDQAVMMAWFDEVLQANQVPKGRAAEIKSRIRFEDTYPAYRRMICGPEDALLIQRFRPLRDIEPTKENNPLRVGANTTNRPPPSDVWDVFDSSGRYLGVVRPPWDNVWRAGDFVRGPDGTWYLYAVMKDDLDVEYVVAWRVEGRLPGAD